MNFSVLDNLFSHYWMGQNGMKSNTKQPGKLSCTMLEYYISLIEFYKSNHIKHTIKGEILHMQYQ